jgi:hypothetical protein
MKCFHLRGVFHPLTDPQKVNRVLYTQEMIPALDNHSRTRFGCLATGDKPWMTFDLCYDTVDEFQEAITSTIEGIPKTKLIQVFQTWRGRLEKCIQQEEDHFEFIEFGAANSICFYSWKVG